MDDCAANKSKKARFDWFSALLVSLALILKHLLHHQLHLVHALQSLVLGHGQATLSHSRHYCQALILHLALPGVSVTHARALAVHSHALWQRVKAGTDQRSQTVFHDFLSPL